MKKQILIIGTICLFIGVGIQPAFAVEITTVKPSEDIEDCNCDVVYNPNLEKLKNQIGKLETYSKLLLLLSKNNPEVKVEYEKLLNDINIIKEIYDDLENNIPVDGRPICDELADMYWTLHYKGGDYYWLSVDYRYEGKLILSLIYFMIAMGYVFLVGFVWKLYNFLGCGTVPEY